MNLLQAQDVAWKVLDDELFHPRLKHVCIMMRKPYTEDSFYIITDEENMSHHSQFAHIVGYYNVRLRHHKIMVDVRSWLHGDCEYHA